MTDPIVPEYLVRVDTPDEPFASHAILPEDLDPLLSKVTRGANLIMDGADAGRRPYAAVLDEVDVVIRWTITGERQPNGTPNANPRRGLHDNVAFYEDLLFGGSDPDTGEKDFELHLDDDLVLVAPIQVRTWDRVRVRRAEALVLTRMVIASGSMIVSGS